MEDSMMEYNSSKTLLKYPEYGRHIQSLVENSANIEDKKERQAYIVKIVSLIEQMNPDYKLIENSSLKIWQNIYNILGVHVDIEYPEGIDRSETKSRYNKAHNMTYPVLNRKFRQHGGNVQKMLDKAIVMEDKAKQLSYLRIIGSYMKNVHRTWSKDHYVNDDVIKNEIKAITKGKIDLSDVDIQFSDLHSSYTKRSSNNRRQQRSGSGGVRKNTNQRKYQNTKRRRK